MAHRGDQFKADLIDRIQRIAAERLEGGGEGGVERLILQFYANIPADDLIGRDLEALYGAVMGLRALARRRPTGEARVRVYNPRADEHGWRSDHTVIEIVNDDMPFLVDSVAMALQRRDCTIHLLVHPVLTVRRAADGTLLEFTEPGAEGARLESLMHVEINRQADQAVSGLAAVLDGVLRDVRAAVEDWQPMRDRLIDILDTLGEPPPGLSGDEVTEARDFLRWLHDDHFTFLGYRAFTFDDSGAGISVDPGSGLGLMRDPTLRVFDEGCDLAAMPAEVQAFLRRPHLLMITKGDRAATVHRAAPLDIIGIKRFDEHGRVTGLHAAVGLYTAAAYTRPPAQIPVLRRKVQYCIRRAGFRPSSHDGKALLNILDGYPRDELFQAAEDQLYDTVIGILHLQQRNRVAVFSRRDEFGRFTSCLVFVPRDRYDTALRLAAQSILEQAYGGRVVNFYTQVGDAPLARLHFIIRSTTETPVLSTTELEERIAEAARSWIDRLRDVLVETHGEDQGTLLWRAYGRAFPASYQERHGPQVAVFDIDRLEATLTSRELGMSLYRPVEAGDSEARLKLYLAGRPLPLSDVLPVLENLGLRVISEEPHAVRPNGKVAWLHDFGLESADGAAIDITALRDRFHEAFRRIWLGEAENDGFNKLVLRAGLDWRQVTVLRAYCRYLRQLGVSFSLAYLQQVLAANPTIAALLVKLFEIRFNPAVAGVGEPELTTALGRALDGVASAEDDRILRHLLNLLNATLRTNHWQTQADGSAKPYLSVKLDSRAIDEMPLPKPWVEVFVYSPRVEGVHLRGGKVARGGIRWSDRKEDFRTEILGLMKAQQVKNAVIIPVGAKGGFVVQRPPTPEAGREAALEEGIACYRLFIRGLLDLTDTLRGGQLVPPVQVVRRDGDDPYLVVAADKGTATFSDIANTLSLDYGHWLGDAFASGGSHGYDHKAMGITARGVWVSVQRHFREIGIDVQTTEFSAVGVGDMSGDVFGNGLLRSPHTRLIAAFNHQHIFLDPDPDPTVAFAERQRLFDKPRSQWSDYDPAKISPGGGVFRRDAKAIALSPEIRARLGIAAVVLPPAELIRAVLKAPVDLIFFGGIGTYVKSVHENNAAVGDRTNDAVRVDARDLRARVIAEGANLAMTQLGRIDYALAGGRLNTDAIDNSAGVDTSDHEVNIKILLDAIVDAGDLTAKQRNELLAAMTDEVAGLVLRDNYLQSQAISLAEQVAPQQLGQYDRLMRLLEKAGRLNRAVEYLPDDEALAIRLAAKQGLTRPEIAVLMAYAKIWLYDHVLGCDLPDDPHLVDSLHRYFPSLLRQRFPQAIDGHRLRREIVAAQLTNSMINRVGGSFVSDIMERTGMPPQEIARAFVVVRDAFGLRDLWGEIEGLDNSVPAPVQYALLAELNRLVERSVIWLLRHCPHPIDLAERLRELAAPIAILQESVFQWMPADAADTVAARAADFTAHGVPEPLARRVAVAVVLASAHDLGRIAERTGMDLGLASRLYFAVGGRFGLGWLRASAETLAAGAGSNHWLKLAVAAVIEDLYGVQRELTLRVATCGTDPAVSLDNWIAAHRPAVERAEQLLTELRASGRPDLAILTVANRQIRSLTEG